MKSYKNIQISKVKLLMKSLLTVHRTKRDLSRLEDETKESLKCLAIDSQKWKNFNKIHEEQPIHIVFVCHNPSLWGSLESLYNFLLNASGFKTTIVAVPYRHSSFNDKLFHDGGMMAYLKNEGINFIEGYYKDDNKWFDLQRLSPDYVFFQTPYEHQFPFKYSSFYVSLFARICYVPYYGTLLYDGEVNVVTHPSSFFKNVSIYFVTDAYEKGDAYRKLKGIMQDDQIVISGSLKVDYIYQNQSAIKNERSQKHKNNIKRILWTPRWRTKEGNCHFFDYKDFLLNYAETNPNVDFIFRPHPLCLQNFLRTGELTKNEHDELILRFEKLSNAKLDTSPEYKDIVLSTDVFISDMSSILYEFFMTGKPIIYTHRVNGFNNFGAKLSKGFYWVKNQSELEDTLNMLLNGEDPLLSVRESLIKELLPDNRGRAAELMAEVIRNDFYRITKSRIEFAGIDN